MHIYDYRHSSFLYPFFEKLRQKKHISPFYRYVQLYPYVAIVEKKKYNICKWKAKATVMQKLLFFLHRTRHSPESVLSPQTLWPAPHCSRVTCSQTFLCTFRQARGVVLSNFPRRFYRSLYLSTSSSCRFEGKKIGVAVLYEWTETGQDTKYYVNHLCFEVSRNKGR